MACGGTPAPTNTANTTANIANNSTTNAPANSANVANVTNTANKANTANATKPVNATAAKPAAAGPKRVAFAAGKSEGNESVSLAGGESKQFIFGAKSGQIFMVDADSKDLEITMVKGKVATDATLIEPGHYDTTLLGDGDFFFQVKNTSKKEVKSSIKIIIGHTGISTR